MFGNRPRRPRPLRRLVIAVIVLSLLAAITGVGWLYAGGWIGPGSQVGPPPVVVPGDAGLGSPVNRVQPAQALAVLATLEVKGRAPKTNYDRAAFGEAWLDADANGCDTRNDVLRRDLQDAALVAGSRCLVASGALHDPYTGTTIAFTRGADTSAAVQIDHVVALGNAWATGAQQLSAVQRANLANDPLNLLAVDGPTNQDKGSGDAATWLPPAKGYRCAYVARQVSVKAAYNLWVTPAERDAMERILRGCPGTQSLESGYPRR
ncbi:HNH endonuclease family protein [Arthrobacter sp. 35W]|uniref:HNH endonuclease family protein n=1 Tax=Arthrobacter sp. 35W TaxID=1132441 RepID=UPI00040A2239|nr:HNH endonuclease family protein [Arthrobacter sp. 35W]